MPLNIRIQWNAGTACVSECVLKTLACRGLRVGPSKGKSQKAEKNNELCKLAIDEEEGPWGEGEASPEGVRPPFRNEETHKHK